MQKDFWLVVLGYPHCGKTTYARWLTHEFARAILDNKKNVVIHGVDVGYVRVPILICVGEFTEWLKQNPTMQLIDYLGHHTWLNEPYCSNAKDFGMLKELVDHGRALIIIDGLNEIETPELRHTVEELVQKFILSHTVTVDLISPIDDPTLAQCGLKREYQNGNCYTE
ncbi:unnamed protein product, partial [Rotaria sp. Silwood1]